MASTQFVLLCLFQKVDPLLRRWKTHVAEAFMVEIHHHLLPFYSAGSQDRQVSVNRCWREKDKTPPELDSNSLFYYSKTELLFRCNTLRCCEDDRCDPTAAGITPA